MLKYLIKDFTHYLFNGAYQTVLLICTTMEETKVSNMTHVLII